jgi:hypothetical protein
MALVTKGSCVGILYKKNKANQNAVHNGKLLSPTTVNTNKLPNVVRIVHYTKVKNPNPTPTHKYLMKREVLALKPIQLQKTPDD